MSPQHSPQSCPNMDQKGFSKWHHTFGSDGLFRKYCSESNKCDASKLSKKSFQKWIANIDHINIPQAEAAAKKGTQKFERCPASYLTGQRFNRAETLINARCDGY